MGKVFCIGVLGLIVVGIGSCQSTDRKQTQHKAVTTDRLEPYECGTITRLHTYGGIFLASQPKPEDFQQAKKVGVKTIINLCHKKEVFGFDERRVVTDLGMVYVSVPWNGPDELGDAIFDRVRELLSTAKRPILLHCMTANRVGAVWIPWRVLDGGVGDQDAVTEAKTVGLKNPVYQEMALGYIQRRRRDNN